jgi:serine/threonine protein phosphatase 1
MSVQVTFAIGDIHGRLDLLKAAVDAIGAHTPQERARLVFLGDYVDRGPDSRGVVELLMALSQAPGVICLKGNHEEMMVRACRAEAGEALAMWLDNGGRATLSSYGVDAPGPEAPPQSHLRWLAGLPLTTGDGRRIYVHAGLKPSTPLEQQSARACLWIREPFLTARADRFEGHVVHGHTPNWSGKPSMAAPELLAHRTNLDTGAYATGVLTVGVFPTGASGGPSELITVRSGEGGAAPVVEITPVGVAAPTPPAPSRLWARFARA